jgi:predicted transcriptional regulator
VRRKLKKMVKHGYVAEKGRSRYITKPGYLQSPQTVAVQQEAIRETLKFMNMCIELGAVKWVDAEPGEKGGEQQKPALLRERVLD